MEKIHVMTNPFLEAFETLLIVFLEEALLNLEESPSGTRRGQKTWESVNLPIDVRLMIIYCAPLDASVLKGPFFFLRGNVRVCARVDVCPCGFAWLCECASWWRSICHCCCVSLWLCLYSSECIRDCLCASVCLSVCLPFVVSAAVCVCLCDSDCILLYVSVIVSVRLCGSVCLPYDVCAAAYVCLSRLSTHPLQHLWLSMCMGGHRYVRLDVFVAVSALICGIFSYVCLRLHLFMPVCVCLFVYIFMCVCVCVGLLYYYYLINH